MPILITFKGINQNGQAIFQAFSPEGAFDVIREGIDTYYRYDLWKGHWVGDPLKVNFI